MEPIHKIGPVRGLEEIVGSSPERGSGASFADSLKDAIRSVDRVQKESEAAQASFAAGEDVELHDVLIKIEEAEVSFKTMMEIRNKLVEAYREVMRLGG